MCKCFQMYINYCFKYPPSAPNFAMISSWVTSICTHGKFKRKTLAQRLTIDMIQIEHSLHNAWSEPIKFLHHTFVPLFAILERYLAASLSNSCANVTAICVNCNSHWSTPGHGSRISVNKMASQPMPGPELEIYFCVNLVMKDYKEYNNKGYDNICLLPWDVSRLSWCMVLQLWCVYHNHLDSHTLAAPCSESSLDSTTVCSSFASFPVIFVSW